MKTGYTVKEILNSDIGDLKKLSGKDLRNVVSTLRDAAAKRYNRALKSGELDPAIVAFRDKYGGKISVKGKTDKELRKELSKGYYFLQSKTSTSTGRKEVRIALESATGVKLNQKQIDKLWQTIDRMSELYELGKLPAFGSLGSNEVRNYVAQQVKQGKSVDKILANAEKGLNELYEQQYETDEDDLF